MALGQIFSRVLCFSPVNFIPPVLHYLEKWKKKTNHLLNHLHHSAAQEASRMRCVRSICCGALHHKRKSTLKGILVLRFYYPVSCNSRSQWPCGLRRGSAAARLLGLRVRISQGARTSVSCECCVLSGRGLCVGLITCPEESYRVWCV
jgi:hypothetical protein